MPTKSIDVDYDLDDFDLDEIIEHLSWNSNELKRGQVTKIKSVINDAEESISDEILNENTLYKAIASRKSMIDQMKMEVILQHLDKYCYLQICEMFEDKLPYQTPSK
jgi:ADP-dependent phosphofructokinase/glucokinase